MQISEDQEEDEDSLTQPTKRELVIKTRQESGSELESFVKVRSKHGKEDTSAYENQDNLSNSLKVCLYLVPCRFSSWNFRHHAA